MSKTSNDLLNDLPTAPSSTFQRSRPVALTGLVTAALLVALASCSGGGGGSNLTGGGGGGGGTGGHGISCGGPDTDSDGLPDCYESSLGTSVHDRDTDGDGLSDYEEVVTKAFDADTNNYQFNPLIADVPQLSFELTSVPDVEVEYTSSTGSEETISAERTNETASTITTSETSTESVGVEVSASSTSQFSLDNFGGSYTSSVSENWEQSFSWTKSQSVENRQAYTEGVAKTSSRSVTNTGGSLWVTLKVRNTGYQVVTLQSLSLAGLQIDPHNPGVVETIGNLEFDTRFKSFSPIDIEPNTTTSSSLIFTRKLSLGRALGLLRDSDNLVLEAATWRAEDADGRSFTHNLTNIGSKDATIVIDYGPRLEREGYNRERYFVSTVGDFNNKRISVADAMQRILRVPYETGVTGWTGSPRDTQFGLMRVRDVYTDPSRNGHWVVLYVHNTDNGAKRVSELYDSVEEGYDFDAIELRKGYILHLVYVEDTDGDGMASREEFIHGTSDLMSDTDGDGLTDAEEIKEGWEIPVTRTMSRTLFSDPLEADADEDNLLDGGEKQKGTNPYVRDTDGDGTWDLSDIQLNPVDMYETLHLPLDGNLQDVTGNGNDGFLPGAIYGRDRFTERSQALALDGNQRLDIPGGLGRQVRHGASWAFWVKSSVLRAQGIMVHNNFSADGGEKQALWMYPDGRLATMAHAYGRLMIFTGPAMPEVNKWHFIVGVISDEDDDQGTDAESFCLFIDGQLVRTVRDSREQSIKLNDLEWHFGTRSTLIPDGLVNNRFLGSIDDIRLFPRALDAGEVKILFDEGR